MMTYREFVLNRVNSSDYYDIWWVTELQKMREAINNSAFETANQLDMLKDWIGYSSFHEAILLSAKAYIDYLYFEKGV